jgi:pimeloyl-ACP methyl ester carboxylesterase
MSSILRLTLVIFLLSSSLLAHASDLAKEKRWADQIVDSLISGDAIWLNDGNSKFLTIYTTAEGNSDRAVIILHGIGAHPDWQQVVHPLRVELPDYGWNTLSIQMPILANDAKPTDYAPLFPKEVPARINAAIQYLHENGVKHIVLVAHSMGSAMGTYYLSKNSKGIEGFVAIGLDGHPGEGVMNVSQLLKSIHIPMLDLYGSDDLKSVLDTRKQRQAAAKSAANKNYSQKMIKGANHFFDGMNDELVSAVSTWLNKLPK